ncbi:MAG: hypothetical protein ACE3JK_09630 [Sporolactobacillus sp.]
MPEMKKSNLRIMGESHSGGGSFNKMSIMGECTIDGDATAESCRVMGECRITGDFSSEKLKNMGELTINGNMTIGEGNILGTTVVTGDCRVKALTLYGQLDCSGNITGEEAKIGGVLNTDGNLTLEKLTMRGGLHVGGLLNADTIDIRLKYNVSNFVREIGAASIAIRKRRSLITHGPLSRLCADVIEADQIYLEQTDAQMVRGKNVVIAVGCKIERVEYTESYQLDGHGEVGKAVQIEGAGK